MPRLLRSLGLLTVLSWAAIGIGRPSAGADDSSDRWTSMPISVSGLPPDAESMPIACAVDFTAILARMGIEGTVDVRSLRLSRPDRDGRRIEVPCQFESAPRRRPSGEGRRLLPDTPPQAVALAEYPANVTPESPKVEGTLGWLADADQHGQARYRLDFGVPRAGRSVQVPFPPRDLRAFDDRGRAAPVRQFPRMQIRPKWPVDGVVHLYDGRDLVTSYHLGPSLDQVRAGTSPFRRPYFYPVHGPDGLPLTELGKPHDPTGSHSHHNSLWIAHFSVNGRNFWGDRGGQIAHERFESLEDGPISCRLVHRTRWIDGGEDLLRERRSLTLYRSSGTSRSLDIELELTPSGAAPVTFGKTTFGFLAARVAAPMTVFDGGGMILNARGGLNEHGVHLRRAEWLDQSGPIAEDRRGGIALFDHPDNPHYPTTWHCRDDGWAGAAFNGGGELTLPPGEALRLHYRVLLHSGDAARAEVGRRHAEFIARPTIQFGDPEEIPTFTPSP